MGNWRKTWAWGLITTLWCLFSVGLASIAIPFASIFVGRKRAFLAVARLWVRIMARMAGIAFSAEGWETLPEAIREGRQPVVFMSNHESHLDPSFIFATIGVHAVFIAKRELAWVPLLGQLIWFMGFIFINRQDRSKAIESLRSAATRIRNGQCVIIFPEGTRTTDGQLRPFKKGGFALAMDAGVPIVPLAARGGFELLPKGSPRVFPGRYKVIYGEPVHPADYPTREAIMEEVRARIQRLVKRADALPVAAD